MGKVKSLDPRPFYRKPTEKTNFTFTNVKNWTNIVGLPYTTGFLQEGGEEGAGGALLLP